MRFKFRFSLRTLLLASFLAGGIMLVWSVHQPWTFKAYRLIKQNKVTIDLDEFAAMKREMNEMRRIMSTTQPTTVPVPTIAWPTMAQTAQSGLVQVWYTNFPEPMIRDISLSPCGNFLLVRPNLYGLADSENIAILNLNDGRIVDSMSKIYQTAWYSERNLLLRLAADFPAEIIQYPEKKTLFSLPPSGYRNRYFSATGKYFIDNGVWDSGRDIAFYSTLAWSPAATFTFAEKPRACWVSPDDRLLLVGTKKLDCAKNHPFECTLEVFEIATQKSLWKWTCPDDVWSIYANFCIGKNGLEVACTCRPFVDKDHPVKQVWTCEKLAALAKRDHEIVEGLSSNELAYNFNPDTGTLLSSYNSPTFQTCMAGAPPSPFEIEKSSDGKWTIALELSAKIIHICDNDDALPVAELVKQKRLISISADGSSIEKPLCISANKQRIVACVGGNALGVWTRTRQHFEWWGLYERPETWLAFTLLGLVLWSLRRDFKS